MGHGVHTGCKRMFSTRRARPAPRQGAPGPPQPIARGRRARPSPSPGGAGPAPACVRTHLALASCVRHGRGGAMWLRTVGGGHPGPRKDAPRPCARDLCARTGPRNLPIATGPTHGARFVVGGSVSWAEQRLPVMRVLRVACHTASQGDSNPPSRRPARTSARPQELLRADAGTMQEGRAWTKGAPPPSASSPPKHHGSTSQQAPRGHNTAVFDTHTHTTTGAHNPHGPPAWRLGAGEVRKRVQGSAACRRHARLRPASFLDDDARDSGLLSCNALCAHIHIQDDPAWTRRTTATPRTWTCAC
jgi:hypothetical protein